MNSQVKPNRFLVIDADAAEDIVSARELQSDEFERGKALGRMLSSTFDLSQLTTHTYVIQEESGIYLLSDKAYHHDILVFDLEAAPVFSEVEPRDALLRFQKVLRFARRRWTNVSPAHNERMIIGSTKAAVFPYPITTQSSFRISIELAPDKQRREKRSRGIEMLIYRIGTDEGGGAQEEAPVTIFRKAIDGLQTAVAKLQNALAQQRQGQEEGTNQVNSLAITRLGDVSLTKGISGCNFDEWQHYITEVQRRFIEHDLKAPHRIEGPAGTGKTLSLVLKCIYGLRQAQNTQSEQRALFVAHSESTRKNIEDMFHPELTRTVQKQNNPFALQSVKITTLHELCRDILRYEISDAELLDRDAFESKQSQLLYALEAFQEITKRDLESHKPFMSASFLKFIEETDEWAIAEMLQHEISVMVKGRAGDDLEKYKKLPRLKYGLPLENGGDKSFIFIIFQAYQRRLEESGQFDTDDVVLTALQNLDTPIWRRRREKEGYDCIYIDETHLFNINELSIFHRLTRNSGIFPIAYSADISQSLGDRGWNEVSLDQALMGDDDERDPGALSTRFSSIFRCSPEIVNLAFSVTSSGATLFTNFDDPLAVASSAFTEEEEEKCAHPAYKLLPNDEQMIDCAFTLADNITSQMRSTRGDVGIVVFDNQLFASAEKIARAGNKPVEVIKHRGDMELVRRARNSQRFVLSTADYVGGLEFDAVILVGVDKGRVPPKISHDTPDSNNYVSYATHQRLYVAITRARYRIVVLGINAHGYSDVFQNAIVSKIIDIDEKECAA